MAAAVDYIDGPEHGPSLQDTIAEAIRQALTEALGPASMPMLLAGSTFNGLGTKGAAGVWTAMAAVRLRDVGAKE